VSTAFCYYLRPHSIKRSYFSAFTTKFPWTVTHWYISKNICAIPQNSAISRSRNPLTFITSYVVNPNYITYASKFTVTSILETTDICLEPCLCFVIRFTQLIQHQNINIPGLEVARKAKFMVRISRHDTPPQATNELATSLYEFETRSKHWNSRDTTVQIQHNIMLQNYTTCWHFRWGGCTYVCSLKMLNMYGGHSMMLVTFNMQTLRHGEVTGYFTVLLTATQRFT
jgi:hypothetical protein